MPRLSAPSRRDCSPDSALAARSRRGGVPSRHRCIAAVPAAVLALLLLAAPGLAAQTEVWTATLTPADLGFTLLGCANSLPAGPCNNTSVLSDDDFTHESTNYTIITLALRGNGRLELDFAGDIPGLNAFTLMVGSNSYLFSAGSNSGNHGKTWSSSGLSLTAGTDVTVKLVSGTTVTAPGAPTSFTATAGDAAVTLSWAAPASDGGGAITEYEYRYSTGTMVSSSASWTDVADGSDMGDSTADETSVTISSLVNGTQYAFEVRAVNSVGDGTAARAGHGDACRHHSTGRRAGQHDRAVRYLVLDGGVN